MATVFCDVCRGKGVAPIEVIVVEGRPATTKIPCPQRAAHDGQKSCPRCVAGVAKCAVCGGFGALQDNGRWLPRVAAENLTAGWPESEPGVGQPSAQERTASAEPERSASAGSAADGERSEALPTTTKNARGERRRALDEGGGAAGSDANGRPAVTAKPRTASAACAPGGERSRARRERTENVCGKRRRALAGGV
jgi:hypothetical protein